MILEQKILEAKAARRKYRIKVGIGLISISLLCFLVIIFASTHQFSNDNAGIFLAELSPNRRVDTKLIQSPAIPDEQYRQGYIDGLSHYENTLKPELDKVDLIKWDKARSEQLELLKNKALVAFTAGDYASATSAIKELNQLAKTTVTDSRQQFDQVLSNAQRSYETDHYEEAKFQIEQAMILNKSSVKAAELAAKIDRLPEILLQLEKINTARAEKNLNKELSLVKDLLKLAPERTAAVIRKQELISRIKQRNFNSYIAQSHQALEQGDAQTAKEKISLAKKIFPKHREVADLTQALQKFEKNQRFEIHQQKAQIAMRSDDWITAKKQLAQALKAQGNDTEIQKSLVLASSIVALNSEFEQYIKSPYRLSNKQLISRLKNKISQASVLTNHSPSLSNNTDALSRLIKDMNTKIAVQVTSDDQTTILVRGVGIVGKTLSKTIQLLPGKYTFEGKRKGFKSKLFDVLVPYDRTSFRVNIRCDELI